jgi:hypothetical protein
VVLDALDALLAFPAVDGVARDVDARDLVGHGDVRAGDHLPPSPAFCDARHRLVAPCLALGDEVLDHADRHQQRECQHCDDGDLDGDGELHAIPPWRMGTSVAPDSGAGMAGRWKSAGNATIYCP